MSGYRVPPMQFGFCIDYPYAFMAGQDPGYALMGSRHRPMPIVDPDDDLDPVGSLEGYGPNYYELLGRQHPEWS